MKKHVRNNKPGNKTTPRSAIASLALIFSLSLFAPPAKALDLAGLARSLCDNKCACTIDAHTIIRDFILEEHDETRKFITDEFKKHQIWLVLDFWRDFVRVAMMSITQDLTVVGMHQMAMIGAFFDAAQQLDVQRLMHEKTAEAHRDYHPAHDMCVIGTAARGLAATNRRGEANAIDLSAHMIQRQLGNLNGNAADGKNMDRRGRLLQYQNKFCNPMDNNNGLGSVCSGGVVIPQRNRDIDYPYLLGDIRRTSEYNLQNTTLADTGDVFVDNEEALLALSNYLYGHNVPERLTEPVIAVEKNQDDYLDVRSVVAKRSVAQNSFNAIAGMRGMGSEASAEVSPYVAVVLEYMGVSADDAAFMIGANPSYYALLETVAQKIYQDPEFFTNLYDKPANVARKDVAMQAIGLMVDRDQFRSELRTEALLAVMLELEIIKFQDSVQNRINWMDERRDRKSVV